MANWCQFLYVPCYNVLGVKLDDFLGFLDEECVGQIILKRDWNGYAGFLVIAVLERQCRYKMSV